jgi:hypothetical protein
MRRTLLTTVVLAALAAWGSAQGPAPGETAGERMDRFARNRALLESLVDRGLELADADSPLSRAKVCHDAVTDISGRLREAAAAEDPTRVAELTEYLGAVLHDGLLPSLVDARNEIPAGSPGEPALLALRDEAAAGLAPLTATDGKFGGSGRIQSARGRLADARGKLEQIR